MQFQSKHHHPHAQDLFHTYVTVCAGLQHPDASCATGCLFQYLRKVEQVRCHLASIAQRTKAGVRKADSVLQIFSKKIEDTSVPELLADQGPNKQQRIIAMLARDPRDIEIPTLLECFWIQNLHPVRTHLVHSCQCNFFLSVCFSVSFGSSCFLFRCQLQRQVHLGAGHHGTGRENECDARPLAPPEAEGTGSSHQSCC